MILIASF